MSRSWSPTKLIETIVIKSATPGKILIQKSPEYIYSKPFPIKRPRDGSVIGSPKPKKLSSGISPFGPSQSEASASG